MSSKDFFEFIIKLIEALTDWPVVLFFIVITFRKQIRHLLLTTVARIQSLEIGKNKIKFLEFEKETFSHALERLIGTIDLTDGHEADNNYLKRENHNAGYDLLNKVKSSFADLPLVFYTGSVSRVNESKARGALGSADTPENLLEIVINRLKWG